MTLLHWWFILHWVLSDCCLCDILLCFLWLFCWLVFNAFCCAWENVSQSCYCDVQTARLCRLCIEVLRVVTSVALSKVWRWLEAQRTVVLGKQTLLVSFYLLLRVAWGRSDTVHTHYNTVQLCNYQTLVSWHTCRPRSLVNFVQLLMFTLFHLQLSASLLLSP